MIQTFLAVSNTLLEWIEYSLFLYLGTTISQQFFVAETPAINLLWTYGLFATAYLFRPLGALVFGHFSDRIGRKPPMIFAMVLMGLATLGMGLLPNASEIGLLAPILLLACRILQSLAVSGEYQSAAIYLIEHNPKPFSGSLIISASCAGIFLGGTIASLLARYGLSADYWRVPFVITGALGLFMSILRYRLLETPVFQAMRANQEIVKRPLALLWQHRTAMLRIIIVAAFVCVFVYTCNGYYAGYLARYTSLSTADAYQYCALTELGVALLAPLIAWHLNARQNAKALLIGAIGMGLTACGMFHSASIDDTALIIVHLVIFTLFDALVTASIAFYLFQQLPANIRCTGVGFGWNLAAALFGGTAPMIAQAFVTRDMHLAPGYMVLLASMAAGSVLWHQLLSNKPAPVKTLPLSQLH